VYDDTVDDAPVIAEVVYSDPIIFGYSEPDDEDSTDIREEDIENRKVNPQTGRLELHIMDFYNAFLLFGALSIGAMSALKYKMKSKRIYISKNI